MTELIGRFQIAGILSAIYAVLALVVWFVASNLVAHKKYAKVPVKTHRLENIAQRIIKYNPGFRITWSRCINVNQKGEQFEVYYPRWGCYSTNEKLELIEGLRAEFFHHFGNQLENCYIHAITSPSAIFLQSMVDEITELGGHLFPNNAVRHPIDIPKEAKFVIFDFNMNSGETLTEAARYIYKTRDQHTDFWIFLYNDLVPLQQRVEPWPNWEENLTYITSASSAIKQLPESDPLAIPLSRMLVIKDAWERNRSWEDIEVRNALSDVQAYVKTRPEQEITVRRNCYHLVGGTNLLHS